MTRDLGLIERLERLYPAVVADCLDRLGLRSQVLEPHIRPLYPEAKVAGFAATVRCVEVDPGDLVLGDYDGVVVVPSAAAEEAVRMAEAKVADENLVREKLAEGMPVAEAFRTYGVL